MYHGFLVMMLRYFLLILFGVPLTPLTWLASVAFLDHISQSTPVFVRKCWIYWWFISWKASFNSLLAPTKVVPLSDVIILTLPRLAMNFFGAKINESVCIEFVISICTALLARHVNIAPYYFSSFLPYFMINGPSISTSQHMKGSKPVTLHLGSSLMFCVPNLLNPIMPSLAINGSNL